MKFSWDFPGIFLGFPRNFPRIFRSRKSGMEFSIYLHGRSRKWEWNLPFTFTFPFPKMGMEFAIHIHIPVPENGNGICHFPFPFPKSKSHSRSWLLSPRHLHAWHLEASNCQAGL